MAVPLLLLKIFNPAEAYIRRDWTERPGPGSAFSEAAVFGPGVPGGARQATAREREEMRSEVDRWAGDQETAVLAATAQVRREHGDELEAGAGQLVAGQTFTFTCTAGRLHTRVVHFWRGDSVVEMEHASRLGEGRSRGRVRRDRARDREVLTGHLIRQVAQLYVDSR